MSDFVLPALPASPVPAELVEHGLPGVAMSSGFTNWRPADEWPALTFTAQEMREWQAWLDEVKRARLRAMEGANSYVVG